MLDGVSLVDHTHNGRLGLHHFIVGVAAIALLHVTVPVRRARQYVHRTLPGTVTLATAGSFDDLSSLILGDHSLHLRQQTFFGRGGRRRLHEYDLGTVPVELFR
jgi:hypothetical protein